MEWQSARVLHHPDGGLRGRRPIETTESSEDKHVVEALNFGSKTTKRVSWEAWEFTVVGPHQIQVTNASWGPLKDDHSYVVGIEERDGRAIPAECACKADQYRDDVRFCKHKVAVATVGGSVVLKAAVDCSTPTGEAEETPSQTLEDKLRADGGAMAENEPDLDGSNHSECSCDDLPDDFPCFACYELDEQEA
jgi:hypothetical protein